MLKSTLILLIVCFTAIVYAKHSIEDCDADDLECLEDFVTTSASKYSDVTSSSSVYEPYSTLLPYNTSDFASDFHEAKVSNKQEKHDIVHKEGQGTIQDSNASEAQAVPESTNESGGLNNVQTGVLSACGVLVVGGIAVGIFVWRNTNEKNAQLDIENQDHPLELSIPTIDSHQVYMHRKKWEKRPMNSEKEQDIALQAMSNQDKENFLPIGSNFLKESTIFSDAHRPADKSLISKFDNGLFAFNDFDLNKSPRQSRPPGHIPSAEDPRHNPLTLTPMLQRVLHTPTVQDSPIRIPLRLTDDSD